MKYIFDIVIWDCNQSNLKTEILEILQIAFSSFKKNENEFIYKYINCINKKLNNIILDELKDYKEYYSIISKLLDTCEKNCINYTINKYNIIHTTMNELYRRNKFYSYFFIPCEEISDLDNLIKYDLKNYLDLIDYKKGERINIIEYKDYLENQGRRKYVSYILGKTSSDTIKDNFYSNLSISLFKPKVEEEIKSYFLSLILDWLNYDKDSILLKKTAYDVLNLEDETINKYNELLKYAIDEKTISHIKEIYKRLYKYRENNKLLSAIVREPFCQDKDHSSQLEKFENKIKKILQDNDMLPLGLYNYKQIPTSIKKNIQDIWDTNIHNKVYPILSYWLKDSDKLFQEIYEKNKIEFLNIINDYVRYDLYSEKNLYIKLKQSIENTTYKALNKNEPMLNINVDKLNNKKDKFIANQYLKYLLSRIFNENINSEVPEEISNQFKYVQNNDIKNIINNMNKQTTDYLSQNNFEYYNKMNIETDKKTNNISFNTLLDENVRILKELKELIYQIDQVAIMLRYSSSIEGPVCYEVLFDIYEFLDLNKKPLIELKPMYYGSLYVITKEQEKYYFYTFINNYFKIIGAKDNKSIEIRNQLIESYYNKYSKMMNTILDDKEEFTNYYTSEAEKYYFTEIKDINDLNKTDIIENFINYLKTISNNYYNNMKEEQLEQFKIAEINQFYQFLANLDQSILNVFSKNIRRFYINIEEETFDNKEKLWEKLQNYLYSDIGMYLDMHLFHNTIEMERIYENHINGEAGEETEKESFKAEYTESIIPVKFNKSDFEDIDNMNKRTERYRRFEFEASGSKAELYSNTFNNHGFIFMIEMNTWLISFYTNAIDKIVEIMSNSEEQIESIQEVEKILSDINNKILKAYEVLFNILVNGIYGDIVENLNNKENINNNQSENPKTIIVRKNPFYIYKNIYKKRMKYYD